VRFKLMFGNLATISNMLTLNLQWATVSKLPVAHNTTDY